MNRIICVFICFILISCSKDNNKNQLDLRSKSNHQQKTSKDQGGKGGWWKFWE